MKTVQEFFGELYSSWESGDEDAGNQAYLAIQDRDREVRKAALEEAAKWLDREKAGWEREEDLRKDDMEKRDCRERASECRQQAEHIRRLVEGDPMAASDVGQPPAG